MGYLPSGLTPGTGSRWSWSPYQLRMLQLMAKLRLAGLEAPQAGKVAAEAAGREGGELTVEISTGVRVTVDIDALLGTVE